MILKKLDATYEKGAKATGDKYHKEFCQLNKIAHNERSSN